MYMSKKDTSSNVYVQEQAELGLPWLHTQHSLHI